MIEVKEQSNTIYLGPREGRTVRMPGAQLLTCKVSGEQTGGAYSLFEAAVGPGGGPLPHIQHREDECFYVLEGRFEFVIEGSKVEAGTGSLIYVLKGKLHAFTNVAEKSGRLLLSQTPGGEYEGFSEEVGEPATELAADGATLQLGRPPDPARLARIGAEYGVEIVLPPL
jgi:mannose-6-phosphate isomerase-like protein (cupin superfamily)